VRDARNSERDPNREATQQTGDDRNHRHPVPAGPRAGLTQCNRFNCFDVLGSRFLLAAVAPLVTHVPPSVERPRCAS
jgi:hypothetical protein